MSSFFLELKKYHPLKKITFLLILGIAVHLLLPQITSLEHSWQVLNSMPTWLVGLAFFAQAGSYLGSGYLLKEILMLSHEAISLLRSVFVVLGSASVGMVAGGMM